MLSCHVYHRSVFIISTQVKMAEENKSVYGLKGSSSFRRKGLKYFGGVPKIIVFFLSLLLYTQIAAPTSQDNNA